MDVPIPHCPITTSLAVVSVSSGQMPPNAIRRQADLPFNLLLDQLLLSVSQLTDQPSTIGYCAVMRQMDFYFHDSCLSRQSVLLLAREIEQDCPDWHIAIHPLLEHEVKTLGFHVLPTVVINGSTVAAGIPKKDWLLERMKECERAGGDRVE